MTWRAIAAEARRSGTTPQRVLQKALDALNWGAKTAGGFAGQQMAKTAIKRALAPKVRHF